MLSEKKRLRALYRQQIKSLLGSEVLEYYSREACHRLGERIAALAPQRIGLYMAMADEPNIDRLIADLCPQMEVYLPKVWDRERMHFYRYYAEHSTLSTDNAYSIREPEPHPESLITPHELDLIIVPAMGYDSLGYRLGRGAGYYDRYLQQSTAHTIGISLPILTIDRLETDRWDIPVDETCPLSPLNQVVQTNR